jgi:hypothetical protein
MSYLEHPFFKQEYGSVSKFHQTNDEPSIDWRYKEIRNCSRLLVATVCILAFSYCLCNENHVFAQTDQSASRLQKANSAVEKAFNNVLEAEKAGGNVTQLLEKLDSAGVLLAEAQNAYNSGNTASIPSIVENALQIADQVNRDALNLRDVSLVESQNSFWLTLTFSVVGAVVLGGFLLFVWRRFKRSYTKKLLASKPEVVDNTS